MKLINSLRKMLYGKIVTLLFIMAMSNISFSQEDKILSLIDKCRSKDWQESLSGIHGLSAIGQEAIPYIVNVFKDKNEGYQTRCNVVQALEMIGAKEAVSVLIEGLSDENHAVRSSCARALGKIGDNSAILYLKRALEDNSEYVVMEAAESLAALGEEKPILLLIYNLKSENFRVRSVTAKTLGEIYKHINITGVSYLMKSLHDDSEESISLETQKHANIMRNRTEYGRLVIPYLIDALMDTPDAEPSGSYVETIEKQTGNIITTSKTSYQTSYGQPIFVIINILGTISLFDDERCVDAIIRILEDNRRPKEAREATADVLNREYHKVAIPRLINIIKQERDAHIVYHINSSLQRLSNRTVKFSPSNKTQEDIDSLARNWEEWLVTQEYADPLERIVKQLKDPKGYNRRKAVDELAKIKDEKVIPILLGMINDDDKDVLSGVISTLANFKNQEVTNALVDIVKRESVDSVLRIDTLAILLQRFDKMESEVLLVQLLKDSDLAMRNHAAAILLSRGNRSGIQIFQDTLYRKNDMGPSSPKREVYEMVCLRIVNLYSNGYLPEVESKVREILNNDNESQELRISCAYGLALNHDYSGIEFLIQMVQKDIYRISNLANSYLERAANRNTSLLPESALETRIKTSKEWVEWWAENRYKGRDEWLAEGFIKYGYPVSNIKDYDSIPTLILALSAPADCVAENANECLKKLTGQDFGFICCPRDKRQKAIEGWNKWWSEQSVRENKG